MPWEERAGTAHPAEMVAIVLVSRSPTPVPRIRHWMPRTRGGRPEASRSEWKSPGLCRGHGWWLIPPPLFKFSLVYQAYRFQINTDSVWGILLGNVVQTSLCCPSRSGSAALPRGHLELRPLTQPDPGNFPRAPSAAAGVGGLKGGKGRVGLSPGSAEDLGGRELGVEGASVEYPLKYLRSDGVGP